MLEGTRIAELREHERQRAIRWKEESRESYESYNQMIERRGLFWRNFLDEPALKDPEGDVLKALLDERDEDER